MVTEEQLLEVYERIVEDERRADACCRDIVFWEARTQIVQLYTNTTASAYGETYPNSGGVVISTIDENVNTGSMRRGLPYTVTFPVKWDDNLYVKNITPFATPPSVNNGCGIQNINNNDAKKTIRVNNYFYAEDKNIYVNSCSSTSSNRAQFLSVTGVTGTYYTGTQINPGNNWGAFTFDKLPDGTVTIKDNRRNTNYNIIRFYTQWLLRECLDGTSFTDWEPLVV